MNFTVLDVSLFTTVRPGQRNSSGHCSVSFAVGVRKVGAWNEVAHVPSAPSNRRPRRGLAENPEASAAVMAAAAAAVGARATPL